MGKKSRKKVDAGELTEPEAIVEAPVEAEAQTPMEKRDITEDNVVAVLKELGGSAKTNQIRAKLGQPVLQCKEPHVIKSADLIRKVAKALIEKGLVTDSVGEKRSHSFTVV